MTTLARIEANRQNAALSTGPRTAEGKAVVARNATRHGIFSAVPVVPGECPETWQAHRAGVVESLTPVGLLELNLAERVALLLWRLHRLARYEAGTIAAGIEDAEVPPLPGPEEPFGSFLTTRKTTRADQLRELRRELRSAREEQAAVVPARDCVGRLPEASDSDAIPTSVAEAIFGAGFDHVVTFAHRRDDPPRFGGKAFRRALGLPDASEPVDWTPDLIRRGLAHYATFTGETPERMLAAVRDGLEEQADDLARTVLRLDAEVVAVARRVDGGRGRKKVEELLPGNGRDERVAKYERHLHNLLTSTLHELERLQARRVGEPVSPPAVADVNLTVASG